MRITPRIAGAVAAVLIVGTLFVRATLHERRIPDAAPEPAAVGTAVLTPLDDETAGPATLELEHGAWRAVIDLDGGILTELGRRTDDGAILSIFGADTGRTGNIGALYPSAPDTSGSALRNLGGRYAVHSSDSGTTSISCRYTDGNLIWLVVKTFTLSADAPLYELEVTVSAGAATEDPVPDADPADGVPPVNPDAPPRTGAGAGEGGSSQPEPGNLSVGLGQGGRLVIAAGRGRAYPKIRSGAYTVPAGAAWAGLDQRYTAHLVLESDPAGPELSYRTDSGLLIPLGSDVSAGQKTLRTRVSLFAGPKSPAILGPLEDAAPGITALSWPDGPLGPVVRVLSALLRQIRFRVLPDWGLTIVLLALLMKLTLLGLSSRSIASADAMKTVAPELKELKERRGMDEMVRRERIADLMRRNRIRPVYTVVNLFIHLLVLVSLHRIFTGLFDFRNAGSAVLGLPHLSQPDVFFVLWGREIRLLPLLILAAAAVQSRVVQKPDPADRMQWLMSFIVPFLFLIVFYGMPSGAALYWLSQTLFSIIEIVIFRRRRPV